ncbi:unnamed protein product, partial [marine sediment metagenome]
MSDRIHMWTFVVLGAVVALHVAGGANPALAQPLNETAKLVPSDGAQDDNSGYSVAISGDTAVVGAYADDDNGSSSGSAYVFRYNGSSWAEEQKLLASDGEANDYFGHAVAISGDTAVVGAYGDDDNGSSSGSAYVFRYNGSNWSEEQKLLAFGGGVGDQFGYSVAISGDAIVIGAPYDDDNGSNSGSAYVFRYTGGNWMLQAMLLASDGEANDYFGRAVAISGDTAVVGAYA